MMSRDLRWAHARAAADYTDTELLRFARKYHCTDPVLAWQFREAWAIRCVNGRS